VSKAHTDSVGGAAVVGTAVGGAGVAGPTDALGAEDGAPLEDGLVPPALEELAVGCGVDVTGATLVAEPDVADPLPPPSADEVQADVASISAAAMTATAAPGRDPSTWAVIRP
jgi:hypothetical protein